MSPHSVLPSDSISQAPRHSRRSGGSHHHSHPHLSPGCSALTPENLRLHDTEPTSRSRHGTEIREEEVEDEALVREEPSASFPKAIPAARSRVSSSQRSASKSVREAASAQPSPEERPAEKKWVIVEVDEYDDRVVEREYTIERVRRYHVSG